MLSQAILKALQVYGIAIAISLLVAGLIKLLVFVTARLHRAAPPSKPQAVATIPRPGAPVPQEVVAAISAALAVVTGPHRILHIAESKRSWSQQGRDAQHSHQPKHK